MRNLAGNFNTLVQDLSCGTRVDTNDRTADRGLSGTGLAYEGEGFSLVDVKRSIFYRFDCVIALAESDIYIFLPAVRFLFHFRQSDHAPADAKQWSCFPAL